MKGEIGISIKIAKMIEDAKDENESASKAKARKTNRHA